MGKVSKITHVTKQNMMKKNQNKTTLSATPIYFAFAWSRSTFSAVKILISILRLLFPCCCLFCWRISPPKPPWAPHSCLLQLQLLWTELGPSMASPNISVLPSVLGAGDSGKGGHKKSLPSCVRADFVEGKPQRECRGVCWGHQARARTWSRDISTPVPSGDWKFRALQRLEGKKKIKRKKKS